MNRLKNWLRGRSEAPDELEADSLVPDFPYPPGKHWWSGLAGGVLEVETGDGAPRLLKWWRQAVSERAEIEALATRVTGVDALPIERWEVHGATLIALQPRWLGPLPADPLLAGRFSLADTDNRMELLGHLYALLARLESASRLPHHFAAWQFWQHPEGAWVLDTLGAPYPPGRVHRALTRRGVDEMHLLPWPAPPDVLSRRGPSPATAVWCLGHLTFELLAGQPPFGHADATLSGMSMLLEGPPSLRTANPQVSRNLDRLVRRMLAADPALRPSSMAECEAELPR